MWSKEKRRQRKSDGKHPTPVPTGLAWGATLVVILVIAASVFILADHLPGIALRFTLFSSTYSQDVR